MTPPVVDPLHADPAVPPPLPAASAPPPAETAPVPTPPPASAQPAATPEAAATPSSSTFLDRFHVVLGGGYNFGTRVNPSAEPFSSAAPGYSGGSIYIQPSYSLFQNNFFDFRLGAGLGTQFLSIPRSPGSESSSITALSLAGMVEGNFSFHQHFGLGTNLALGYMGLMSSNADVGAPFTASFDWGSEGGLYVGWQIYAHTWNQAIRAGVALDTMPTGFGLKTAPGQPDLLVGFQPAWTIFLAVDPVRMIRNFTGGSSSSSSAATPPSR